MRRFNVLYQLLIILKKNKIMNESLRDKLISLIEDMQQRVIQLRKHTMEYKEINDFESAMKCDIKYRQLSLVVQLLNKLID